MVDVTLDQVADSPALVKLQTDTWELNIWAPIADLLRLRDIRDADWDARHSLAVGTCADARVYWTSGDGRVTVLVGHDDETWDIAVAIPPATVEKIVTLAERGNEG